MVLGIGNDHEPDTGRADDPNGPASHRDRASGRGLAVVAHDDDRASGFLCELRQRCQHTADLLIVVRVRVRAKRGHERIDDNERGAVFTNGTPDGRHVERQVDRPGVAVLVEHVFEHVDTSEVGASQPEAGPDRVSESVFGAAYAFTLFVFMIVGAIFVVSRLPQDVRSVGHFDSWDEVRSLAQGTPAEGLVVPGGSVPSADPASWREWLNVGLLMLFTRAVQITLVATIMGAFFVVFGVLTISESTIQSWTGQAPHVLATFTLTGRPLVLTEQLLRVAGFLAAFTGMYFTVVLVTDAVFREEFREDVVSEVRQAFAARALYLAARQRQASE